MESYYLSKISDSTRETESNLEKTNRKLDKLVQGLESTNSKVDKLVQALEPTMASSTARQSEDLKTKTSTLQLDHNEPQRLEIVRILLGTQPTPNALLPDDTIKRRGEFKGYFRPGKPYEYTHPIHKWILKTSYPVDLMSYYPVSDNAKRDRELYWQEQVEAGCEAVSLEALADIWEPCSREEPEKTTDLSRAR